jgi:sec-independent protein translocase protein TatB
MFGISSTELLVILLVAVVAVGPEKMPSIMRTLARMLAEFRRVKTDFHRLMNLELANLEEKKALKPEAPPNFAPEPAPAADQPASAEKNALSADLLEADAGPQNTPEAVAQSVSVADGEGRDER